MGHRWGHWVIAGALAGCGIGAGPSNAALDLSGNESNVGMAGSGGSGSSNGGGGSGSSNGGGDPCRGAQITSAQADAVQLLFVVDNSGSMREEQAALRAQVPRLIAALTTGTRVDGSRFMPARMLNVGVISTDMGLPNVPGRQQLGCGGDERRYGDNGVLNNVPNPGGVAGLSCAANYPPFLNFTATGNPSIDGEQMGRFSNDVACLATLDTAGCGFEMPLESALRALWPSDNVLASGQQGSFSDGRPFIDGTFFGQGAPAGPNTGFLWAANDNPHTVTAIVVLTDEDDCSSHNLGHFVPRQYLQAGDPLRQVGLNLRCHHESVRLGSEDARDRGEGNLYGVQRYVDALRALHAGREDQLVFALIGGVPEDLVTPEFRAAVDFSDEISRNSYYDAMLADARMIEQPDLTLDYTTNPPPIPSCLRTMEGSEQPMRAFPPRRLIKVAKALGENSLVGSLCTDDFTPTIDALIDRIATRLQPTCLPQAHDVSSKGTIDCQLIWELPKPGEAPANTPTLCEQQPFLRPVPAGQATHTDDGRVRCVQDQVAVLPCGSGEGCVNGKTPNVDHNAIDDSGALQPVDGWYYDDFSHEVLTCDPAMQQRITFTRHPGTRVDAAPPAGVTVRLLCEDVLPASCR